MNRRTEPGNVLLTAPQRKIVSNLLPALTDRLRLGEKNSLKIFLTARELETIRQRAEVARFGAENGKVRNSLDCIVDAVTKVLDASTGVGSIPASERLYQFRITLLEAEPLIWRRIQVRNCTLDKLHEYIQAAMGWTNSHLYQFRIDGDHYGDPEWLDSGFHDFHCIDSATTRISEVLPMKGKRFRFLYQYDFGDDWQHEILFEGCVRAEKGGRYPVCVEGERNCPPEDVGGVWGYAEFLEAIADPRHERHEDFAPRGREFDPEEFDAAKKTKAMRR